MGDAVVAFTLSTAMTVGFIARKAAGRDPSPSSTLLHEAEAGFVEDFGDG